MRLSLGLPVFNGGAYLDSCLRSITAQTCADFELIICDNASTDETEAIARAWCARDRRIAYHRAPENRGAARNFNWAFELATGELFKWCAVDDLLEPSFLARCVQALDAHPDAVLAYTGTLDIDERGTVVREIYDNSTALAFDAPDVAARFRDLVVVDHSCISVFGVIRSAALRDTALIAPYPGSDRALLVELGLRARFVRIVDNLMLHREHVERSTKKYPRMLDRVLWFSGRRARLSFPHFRLLGVYTYDMLRTPMSMRQRLRCLEALVRWIYWGAWRRLLKDITDHFR
ncbi:MAG: glycosyltransferase family 2 protein [Rubrivivax sp.]|nr:glycosyltransferase family 2 protein [Rubrivivax sp.]